MQVEANRRPIEDLDVQALAVAVYKDEKPGQGFLKKLDELSGGLVQSAIEAEEFSAKEGETPYSHLGGNEKLKFRRGGSRQSRLLCGKPLPLRWRDCLL